MPQYSARKTRRIGGENEEPMYNILFARKASSVETELISSK
jgi:hypothetical protein